MKEIIGQGWAFPPRIGDRGRVEMVDEDAEIRQAIHIILNTAPGERVMRPEFGCRIHEILFWPANSATAAVAERYIAEALGRWEPRIQLEQIVAEPAQLEDDKGDPVGALIIEMRYRIKGTHDLRSLVFPFYLSPA
jgi:phage baseplate assembly protein W